MIHICKCHNLVNYPPCLDFADTGGTCAVVCSLLLRAPGVSQYACMMNTVDFSKVATTFANAMSSHD